MSAARGNIRKIYDLGPASLTSTGDYDGSTTGTVTAWASGIATIWASQIPQSVNDNGRVGISAAVESLDLRMRITPQPSVVGYQHLRMIVFADNECDGTTPAVTDLLGDTTGLATTVLTGIEMSFLQPAYLGRFSVIEDKNWFLYSSSTANTFTEKDGTSLWHESHHDMKGHRLMWDTTDSSAIANARKGHIFILLIYSNQVCSTGGLPNTADMVTGLTTANPPCIQYTARFRFTDA